MIIAVILWQWQYEGLYPELFIEQKQNIIDEFPIVYSDCCNSTVLFFSYRITEILLLTNICFNNEPNFSFKHSRYYSKHIAIETKIQHLFINSTKALFVNRKNLWLDYLKKKKKKMKDKRINDNYNNIEEYL